MRRESVSKSVACFGSGSGIDRSLLAAGEKLPVPFAGAGATRAQVNDDHLLTSRQRGTQFGVGADEACGQGRQLYNCFKTFSRHPNPLANLTPDGCACLRPQRRTQLVKLCRLEQIQQPVGPPLRQEVAFLPPSVLATVDLGQLTEAGLWQIRSVVGRNVHTFVRKGGKMNSYMNALSSILTVNPLSRPITFSLAGRRKLEQSPKVPRFAADVEP